MKKILLLSAALVAVLTGPALAQRDNGRGDGPRTQQGQTDGNRGGFRGGDRSGIGPTTQAAPPAELQNFNRGNDNRGADNNRRDFNHGDNRSDVNRGGRDGRPDFRQGNDRRDFGRNNNDRRWDNNRYDNRPGFNNRRYSQYYRNWNSQNRFRAGAYYRPQGFSYRRWSYGDILPSLFWGSRYQLSNYYAYDLPPPPPGTVWVRYGDDALLIDRYSGEVIQVSYSVFW